jgi:hypothetical protein
MNGNTVFERPVDAVSDSDATQTQREKYIEWRGADKNSALGHRRLVQGITLEFTAEDTATPREA